jgi:hypothetical protein
VKVGWGRADRETAEIEKEKSDTFLGVALLFYVGGRAI